MSSTKRILDPQFTRPEHLGDPYLGVWLIDEAFDQKAIDAVTQEVLSSGQVEPIRQNAGSTTNQIFERLIVDFTWAHEFPRLQALGVALGEKVVKGTVGLFPNARKYQIDEAAVQIYPPDTELALGWHKDHPLDDYFVISAVLTGSGRIGFTEKEKFKSASAEDILIEIQTRARQAVVFRANGLYERDDGSDIRVAHAVTYVDPGEPRFSVQYRMGVNAADYGNVPINRRAA